MSHPVLAQRRITRIYVKEVSFPKRQQGGEWHIDVKVIQWLPSMTDRRGRSVTRTPDGATIGDRGTIFPGLTLPEAGEENSPNDGDAAADPAVTDTGP